MGGKYSPSRPGGTHGRIAETYFVSNPKWKKQNNFITKSNWPTFQIWVEVPPSGLFSVTVDFDVAPLPIRMRIEDKMGGSVGKSDWPTECRAQPKVHWKTEIAAAPRWESTAQECLPTFLHLQTPPQVILLKLTQKSGFSQTRKNINVSYEFSLWINRLLKNQQYYQRPIKSIRNSTGQYPPHHQQMQERWG